MKLRRLFLATLLAMALSTSSFAQADKDKKAETKTEAKSKKDAKVSKGEVSSEKKTPLKTGMDAALCQAMTKDGDQCKRKPSAGSKFCWQHGGKKGGDTANKKKG